VAVIGGGNTAVEEALYLANIASHVTLVHRRDRLRSEKILQDKLFAKEQAGKVTIRWNCTLDEVLGDAVRGNRHAHSQQAHRTTEDLPLMGVFIAIGHRPNTELFAGQLEMEGGYLLTQWRTPGQFHGDLGRRRLCRRRRAGPHLPPGLHLGRQWLHGGARCRALPRQPRPGRLRGGGASQRSEALDMRAEGHRDAMLAMNHRIDPMPEDRGRVSRRRRRCDAAAQARSRQPRTARNQARDRGSARLDEAAVIAEMLHAPLGHR
jgi:hypothetical protein